MDKLREEFEAEFKRRNCNVPASRIKTMLELYNYGTEENPDWDYYSLDARHAFEWWQASRASIVVDVPQACAFNLCDLVSRDDVIEAIRSIGLSIKGE
ncbi:hypothetical protein [Serratia nematodiphila]|uniref:hypothetical protein n=1 Tax=Serratia nematodiphila TaxID=458197 RepID=UPI0011D8F817|nr:hypothetical protein [Serratia nematodiphila]TXE64821.1 hypothetical protein FOT58_10825 [Serratia nematodiphila]